MSNFQNLIDGEPDLSLSKVWRTMRPWHQFHLHWEQNWRELGSKPSQIVSREGERRESHKTNSIFKRWHFTPIVTQVKTKVGCWNQLAMNKLELNEPAHMPVANIFGGWIPHASVSWVLGMKAVGLRPPTQPAHQIHHYSSSFTLWICQNHVYNEPNCKIQY